MTRQKVPLKAGLHDIEADVYHSDPCERASLSSTVAKTILAQSPLHGWTISPRLNPGWTPIEKTEFDVGRAAHRMILGKGGEYAEIPPDLLASNGAASTKAAKEWIAEARASGITPLKSDQVAAIHQMAWAAKQRLRLHDIGFVPDESEVTAIAEIEGCMCRAMIDNAPEDPTIPLYDFKTTTDASPEAATKAIMNYSYDVQAAHYIDTWKAATGQDRRFRFVFQEKKAPFEVAVVELGSEALVIARKKIARAREIWRGCLASGKWPGYPIGVLVANMPPWFYDRWLERESVEADYAMAEGRDVYDIARKWQSPEGLTGEPT